MKIWLPKFIKNNEDSWFTDYAHRWPDAAMPMGYAMACIEVVASSSGEAGNIFKELVKAWSKPGTDELYNVVISRMSNSEMEEWKELIKHPESIIKSDINEPWEELKSALECPDFSKSIVRGKWKINVDNVETKYPDVWNITKLVVEFILIGFNRDVDVQQGKYKVVPTFSPPWLILLVMLRTAFESKNITTEKMNKLYKAKKIKGEIYNFEEVLTLKPMSYMHRQVAKNRQRKNVKLHHDSKFLDAAWLWYQCRIVYSSINEFLIKETDKGKEKLDLKNVQKEVQLCDKAIGYKKKGVTLD